MKTDEFAPILDENVHINRRSIERFKLKNIGERD